MEMQSCSASGLNGLKRLWRPEAAFLKSLNSLYSVPTFSSASSECCCCFFSATDCFSRKQSVSAFFPLPPATSPFFIVHTITQEHRWGFSFFVKSRLFVLSIVVFRFCCSNMWSWRLVWSHSSAQPVAVMSERLLCQTLDAFGKMIQNWL